MTIIEFLKTDETSRITSGHKWMIWDNGVWKVYEKVYRKSHGVLICETEDEEIALVEFETN